MKKVILGIMLMLLCSNMLSLASHVQPVKADAKTIYVDDDNTMGPWDGTKDHPYQNITIALQYASAWSTIHICNGVYYESIIVNKTVSLVGENKKTTIIDGGGRGSVVEVTADSVTITGFAIRNSKREYPYSGLTFITVENCSVFGNDITNNYDGMRFSDFSNNNSISANAITNNLGGIALSFSSNNSIHGNNVSANNGFGIFLHRSLNNTMYENNIVSNHWGIELDFSSDYNRVFENNIEANDIDGIGFDHSSNNTISRNNITANGECGMRISGTSTFNYISGNDVIDNSDGIRLEGSSSNNTIYHNNFVGNQQHASASNSDGNHWDSDYPSGGNYWSDYQEKYSNASEIDNSGIWNTPYIIDSGNRDRYPLMNKYAIPEKTFSTPWLDYVILFLILFLPISLTYFMIKRRSSQKKIGGSMSKKLVSLL